MKIREVMPVPFNSKLSLHSENLAYGKGNIRSSKMIAFNFLFTERNFEFFTFAVNMNNNKFLDQK